MVKRREQQKELWEGKQGKLKIRDAQYPGLYIAYVVVSEMDCDGRDR